MSEEARARDGGVDRLLHAGLVEGRAFDFVEAGWFLVVRKQLHGTDTVAADGGKEIERLSRAGGETGLKAAADGGAVREEVFEEVADDRTAVRRVAGHEGPRERQHAGGVGSDPSRVIVKCRRARARLGPRADAEVVHPDGEGTGGGHLPGRRLGGVRLPGARRYGDRVLDGKAAAEQGDELGDLVEAGAPGRGFDAGDALLAHAEQGAGLLLTETARLPEGAIVFGRFRNRAFNLKNTKWASDWSPNANVDTPYLEQDHGRIEAQQKQQLLNNVLVVTFRQVGNGLASSQA